MKMRVGVLDHYNVSTQKRAEIVHFYENVLSFTNGPRPPFSFPGAWLYSSGLEIKGRFPILQVSIYDNLTKSRDSVSSRATAGRREPWLLEDKASAPRTALLGAS